MSVNGNIIFHFITEANVHKYYREYTVNLLNFPSFMERFFNFCKKKKKPQKMYWQKITRAFSVFLWNSFFLQYGLCLTCKSVSLCTDYSEEYEMLPIIQIKWTQSNNNNQRHILKLTPVRCFIITA